jgi:Pyruvate/2-oxoacid:ferredoxin oxidoreductase delta subunit
MKQSNTPMGEAFKIAIMIGKSEEGESEEESEDEGLPEGVTNPIIKLAPAEAEYVESMFEIVEKYGKLADNDKNGIWVGYEPPAQNEKKSMGVKCSNCAFWCPKMKGCHIIVAKAEANGYCRLAAIGEGLKK